MIESEIPVFASNERGDCRPAVYHVTVENWNESFGPSHGIPGSGKISADRFNFDFVALTAIPELAIPELKDAKLELVKSRIEFAGNLLE